jgi:CubicO group peptidase (beta-lactamase class C family)
MKSNSNYVLFKNGVLILLLLVSNINFAQTKVEQIEELLSTCEAYGKFNGSVLVSDQGKVLYKKGFGLANMEWDIPNQPNTKHRLGSITKQFTAMLILQLVAEGKLDLKAPITTYLPDYPKTSGDVITIHHLLTHTSGIPNYTAFPKFMEDESRNPYTPEEFLKTFADKALDFTPGDKFSYSNSGYFLLGVLIEKLAGKSYEKMLQDKIFIPLNMKDSGYDNHGDIL